MLTKINRQYIDPMLAHSSEIPKYLLVNDSEDKEESAEEEERKREAKRRKGRKRKRMMSDGAMKRMGKENGFRMTGSGVMKTKSNLKVIRTRKN